MLELRRGFEPMTESIVSDVPPPTAETNPEKEEYLKRLRAECAEVEKSPFRSLMFKAYFGYDHFIAEDDDTGEKLGFKPAKVAAYIATEEKFLTDIKTGILYFYNGKTWVPNAEPYLEYILVKILGEENKVSHFKNILHSLKGLTYDNITFSKKIAVENGLFDVETQTLTEFSADEMPFYAFPVTYNPKVDPSKLDNWLEYLKQVVNPDDVPLLQQWFGYCLLPDYRFHKALWIHGEGRNGKGVYDRTIQGIIGKQNVVAQGLEELDGTHRFALKNYYGKLYAVSSEPATNKIFRTELFQKLCGSDVIQA